MKVAVTRFVVVSLRLQYLSKQSCYTNEREMRLQLFINNFTNKFFINHHESRNKLQSFSRNERELSKHNELINEGINSLRQDNNFVISYRHFHFFLNIAYNAHYNDNYCELSKSLSRSQLS